MRIGLIPNSDKDTGLSFTRTVIDWIVQQGCDLVLENETADIVGMPEYSAEPSIVYGDVDFLIVLGGDGTMLRASHMAAEFDTPILGINLGNLGYLTDVERYRGIQAIEAVLSGEYKQERRMMLSVMRGGMEHMALNDVCITRGALSKLIQMELYINDEYIDTFRADGMICCTPTGSTAYNLSAGGPVLKSDVEMIAITPVCPHMIYARSIVCSAEDFVRLRLVESPSYADAILSMDGQHTGILKAGDEVEIMRSRRHTTVIKTSGLGFFDILRYKMVDSRRG